MRVLGSRIPYHVPDPRSTQADVVVPLGKLDRVPRIRTLLNVRQWMAALSTFEYVNQ